MDEKYFIPSVQDIHIGYECEILCGNLKKPDQKMTLIYGEWKKFILTENACKNYGSGSRWNGLAIFMEDVETEQIRTPYLTKQQIETEGWKINEQYNDEIVALKGGIAGASDSSIFSLHKKGEGYFRYSMKTYEMKIHATTGRFTMDGPESEVVYKGKCRCINDFRKIIKFIEIK